MKLYDFVICDFIRQENTGKYILFGVYDDILIFTQKEKTEYYNLPISFFLRFRLTEEDQEIPTDFRFIVNYDAEGSSPKELKSKLEMVGGAGQKPEKIQLILQMGNLQIPYNTKKIDFKITFNYASGKNITIELGKLIVMGKEQILNVIGEEKKT